MGNCSARPFKLLLTDAFDETQPCLRRRSCLQLLSDGLQKEIDIRGWRGDEALQTAAGDPVHQERGKWCRHCHCNRLHRPIRDIAPLPLVRPEKGVGDPLGFVESVMQ